MAQFPTGKSYNYTWQSTKFSGVTYSGSDISQFTNNASATPTPFSIGTWTSSGNRCIYQPYNTAAITTVQTASTSTTFAVRVDTAANVFVTGVIQNVGATTFQIAWTETGAAAARVYMWEAE